MVRRKSFRSWKGMGSRVDEIKICSGQRRTDDKSTRCDVDMYKCKVDFVSDREEHLNDTLVAESHQYKQTASMKVDCWYKVSANSVQVGIT
jgi:hypothetical protein